MAELVALGAVAFLGYYLAKQPIRDRTKLQKAPRAPLSEQEAANLRFTQGQHPLQTGVFVNKALMSNEPLPMFSSRRLQNDPSVNMKKLEMFTGTEVQGGLSLKPRKQEQGPLFDTSVSRVAVSFSGTGGNLNYVPDQSRFIPSNMHNNVSCTVPFKDIPAIQEDPLHRYTPVVPGSQKFGAQKLPLPNVPTAPVPTMTTPVAPTTRLEKTNRGTVNNAWVNPSSPYDHRPSSGIGVQEARAPKVCEQPYFGGPVAMVTEEFVSFGMEATRDGKISANPVEPYYGSGSRIFGPSDIPVAQFQEPQRKGLGTLPVAHPTATGVRSDREYRGPGEIQGRTRTNGEQGLLDTTERNPGVFAMASASSDFQAQSRKTEDFAVNPELSRALDPVTRPEFCAHVKDKSSDPLMVGHASAQAVPERPQDLGYAECRDKVIVQNVETVMDRGFTRDTVETTVCSKSRENAYDPSALHPTAVNVPDKTPELPTVTCRNAVTSENPYVPVTHMQID